MPGGKLIPVSWITGRTDRRRAKTAMFLSCPTRPWSVWRILSFRHYLLFLFRLRGFSRQPLGLQSFIIFPEGFLRFFVFRCRLLFTGALKSPPRFSLIECEVLPYFIAHRSPPISVTSEKTIARQRCAASKPAD